MADFVGLKNGQANPSGSHIATACKWIVEKMSGEKFKWTRRSDCGNHNVKSEIHAKPECHFRGATKRKGRRVVQTIQRNCYCERRF